MQSLKQLSEKYYKDGFPDKFTEHSYGGVYEELLAPYRNTAKNILEIGILGGQSLLMWKEYFLGIVWGVDCTEKPLGKYDLTPLMKEGHNIKIMDATDPVQILEHFCDVKFDVIIDDASHIINHQLKTYNILKSYMAKGSIYIIEDIADIDRDKKLFKELSPNIQILDRRDIKNRFDDVLVIIRNG